METKYIHSVMERFRDQTLMEQFAAELNHHLDLSKFVPDIWIVTILTSGSDSAVLAEILRDAYGGVVPAEVSRRNFT